MDMTCPYCKQISGRAIPVPGDDIDTDRIIPARFMKCITFEGIGYYAFYDVRFDENNNEKEHPFNDPRYRGGEILIVNRNFGCGSSREHAPQSLMDYGITGFIGESFAEIFAGNCTALGMPTVTASADNIDELMALVESAPETVITIDLAEKVITAGDKSWPLDMQESYRRSLISGTWDSTATLIANRDDIENKAKNLPYMHNFS